MSTYQRFWFTLGAVITLMFFASVSQAVTIKTVAVGNQGNAGEWSGDTLARICGAVDYGYSIGEYEVTNSQYCEFLNAVAISDPHDLYNTDMGGGWNDIGGISRSGSDGNYTYAVRPNRGNRPVNYVSWYDTLRFANWLHNGQPSGPQSANTTEDGAYDMSLGSNVVRKPGALFCLPSENEWYKAAYHKNNGVTGSYWDYPTGTDSVPSNDLVNPDPGNNANFYHNGYTIGSPYYTTEVGEFENSESPYGTFDQGGNVWEWNEAIVSGLDRGVRGGWAGSYDSRLQASFREYGYSPTSELYSLGFRVAKLPQEPTAVTRPDTDPSLSPGKPGLVYIVHGWNSAPDKWADGMKDAIETRLADAGEAANWDVQTLDWSELANMTPGPIPNPFVTAQLPSLGMRIGKAIYDAGYDKIHFIAHSAGSLIIEGASEKLRDLEDSNDPLVIQSTFLDAFVGYSLAGVWAFGDEADWAEHYQAIGGVGGQRLFNAYNIDITDVPGGGGHHGWPYEWYTMSVDDAYEEDYGWGFEQSMETDNLPSHDQYPRGGQLVLPEGQPGDEPSPSVRRDTPCNLEESVFARSDTGTINLDGTQLSIQTGSPVWITTLLETDELVNFVTFDVDFVSDEGAEGLLAIYWEEGLIGIIDERYVLEGVQEYLFSLPSSMAPGTYQLSFRLEPYTEIDSVALIDNVATGYAVPEPSSLGLMTIASISLLLLGFRKRYRR